MLRRLRTSSPARLALGLAAVLAVASAFGLHPEQPLRVAGASDGAEISRIAGQPASHLCPACLNHGASVVWLFAGATLVPASTRPAARGEAPALFARLAGRDLSGRSPPARS